MAVSATDIGLLIGSGLTDSTGAAAHKNEAHTTEGQSHLLYQFRDAQRINDFVSAFLDQIQEIENAVWQLYVLRSLSTAEGVQLDGLGDLVGEHRNDRTDAAYRLSIQVRILVNRSDGQMEQLIAIAVLFLGEPVVVQTSEYYPAVVYIEIRSDIGTADPFELFSLLKLARAAGVALHMVYTYSAETGTFEFDADTTLGADINLGFGSTTDSSWGGDLASVLAG